LPYGRRDFKVYKKCSKKQQIKFNSFNLIRTNIYRNDYFVRNGVTGDSKGRSVSATKKCEKENQKKEKRKTKKKRKTTKIKRDALF
jgi:hypothetical protein